VRNRESFVPCWFRPCLSHASVISALDLIVDSSTDNFFVKMSDILNYLEQNFVYVDIWVFNIKQLNINENKNCSQSPHSEKDVPKEMQIIRFFFRRFTHTSSGQCPFFFKCHRFLSLRSEFNLSCLVSMLVTPGEYGWGVYAKGNKSHKT